MTKHLWPVALLCAATGLSPAKAEAAELSNGLSFNGRNVNGLSFNGRDLNGLSFNGRNINGLSFNGRNMNGASSHGLVSVFGELPIVEAVLPDGTAVTLR